MALIDQGTHLTDPETGSNFATAESPPKPRKVVSRKYRSPAFWDTAFGLYVEHRDGKLTRQDIAKALKVSYFTLYNHADKAGWDEKADAVIRKRNGVIPKTLAINPAEVVADTMTADQKEFRGNVSEMLANASRSVRKMKPATYLQKTKEVKEMVDTMKTVNPWKGEEEKAAGSGPVLNVAFLLGEGMKAVSVSATEAAVPRQDSPEF